MCRGQESDIEEQIQIDNALQCAFTTWKACVSHDLSDEDIDQMNWIDEFIREVRMRLQDTQDGRKDPDTELDALIDEYCAYLRAKD